MKVLEMNSSPLNSTALRCDGCGQLASPEHIARRLQRLEWTTRFRPLHIGTLLLGAIAPRNDNELIYSPAGAWDGEAKMLLAAARIFSDACAGGPIGRRRRRQDSSTHCQSTFSLANANSPLAQTEEVGAYFKVVGTILIRFDLGRIALRDSA